MRKKLLSIFLSLVLAVQLMPATFAAASDGILISDFELAQELETVAQVIIYGGDTEIVTYQNSPKTNYQYLIVQADVSVALGNKVDLDALYVQINGANYARITSDSFLEDHGYSAMRHGETSIDTSGTAIFEIPQALTQSNVLSSAKLMLSSGVSTSFQIETEENSSLILQKEYDGYVARQAELNEIYQAIASTSDFTPQEPYIIVNPYEIAPLSAIIIFETEYPSTVTTSIIGKTDETTISNTIEEQKTYHELPLIGLYQGENTVEVQVTSDYGTEVYEYEIETETATKLPVITVQEQDLTQISDGLYMLKNPFRTLVDVNGDIRGYFNIYTGCSELDEVSENGHFWVSENGYTLYSTIYEFDYLGYIYNEIHLNSINTHHDAYLIDDNTLLTNNGAINIEQGTFSSYSRSWESIFNSTQGSFEVRDNGSSDWLHFNTIADCGDGYILVSMRNQHAIAKLSYPDMQVQWVLSVNDQACVNDLDKYLTPIGDDFEWFYSQHDVSLVSENADGTIDITVFDNGIQRGLDPDAEYIADDMYSRMVTYRIDESKMTVEQIWDFGQELGTDGLSYVHGSTQYIEQSETYLGCFDTYSDIQSGGVELERQKAQIIEVNQDGEIVLALDVLEAVYRAEKVTIESLYSCFEGIANLEGQYSYVPNTQPEKLSLSYATKSATSQILSISANQDYLNINGYVTGGTIADSVTDRKLMLQNNATGEQFFFSLAENSTQTLDAAVNISLRFVLDTSAGFYQEHINISEFEDGNYSLYLVATQNGENFLSVTGYTLKIGQDVVDVESQGVVEQHTKITEQLLELYNAYDYTLENPMVVLNPYETSPLSALVAFETDEFGSISVQIDGKDEYTTITHEFSQVEESHILPIYGLYADYNNKVTITFTSISGVVSQEIIYIKTQELPADMPVADITVANTELMADGFTYGIMEGGGSFAFDANGDIRWYTTIEISTMPIKRLENGNIISGSNTKVELEATAASLFEFDMLGRVVNEYLIYGAHHEVLELANGDLLVAASVGDTVEDYIVRLDRTTGEIVQDWDMKEILSDMEYISDPDWQLHIYNNQTVNNPSATETAKWNTVAKRSENDWFHNNALYYDEAENTIMASGRMKDAIVKFDADTGEVIWILADPNTDWAEAYADKLLTPIGDDFEYSYGNHAVTVADDGDILLFDNGNYRSKEIETALEPNDTYSRGVRYSINEENMTVTQVWQYGKELGSVAFSSYISDIDYLDTDHYLINFGGILTDMATGEAFNSTAMQKQEHVIDPQGVTYIVEIIDDQIVFEMNLSAADGTANTYRVERMTPYYTGEGYYDLTLVSKRLGSLETTKTVSDIQISGYTNDIDFEINSIFDSGEDVYFDIAVEDYASYYIVLDDGQNQLVYSDKSIVKYGLENGKYLVGILVVDEQGNTHLQNTYCQITVDIADYGYYYGDVDEYNWFFSEVMSATYAGLFKGTDVGVFSPYENMTVAMVETVLNRMSDGEYLVSDDLLELISAQKQDDITREQLATVIYDYATFIGLDMTQNTNILSYNDAFDVSDYAFEALQWTNEKGIILGTDENCLQPQDIANRSQVAAVMMRLRALSL